LAVQPKHIEGFDPQEVAYNMALMSDEGLIEAVIHPSSDGDGRIALALFVA
jgi:hypothetical protein